MTTSDISGDGGTTPLPPMPEHKFQATLGGEDSPLFDTREEAKAWIQSSREAAEDWDSDSIVNMIFEE